MICTYSAFLVPMAAHFALLSLRRRMQAVASKVRAHDSAALTMAALTTAPKLKNDDEEEDEEEGAGWNRITPGPFSGLFFQYPVRSSLQQQLKYSF